MSALCAAVIVIAVSPALALDDDAGAERPEPRFFTDMSFGLPDRPLTAVAVDPGDPEVILVGLDGFVFKTDDGGESWRPVLAFPSGLAVDATLEVLDDVPDEDEGRRFDDEDPDAMENLGSGDSADDFAPGSADPYEADIDPIFDDSQLPDGDFQGQVRPLLPRQEAGVRTIRFVDASRGTVYVGTPRGLYRSIDLGETFTRIDLPAGQAGDDVRDVAVDPVRPSRIYAATKAGLIVSKDGGNTFEWPSGLARSPSLSVLAGRVDDEDLVLLGTEQGLLRSWDAGASFLPMMLQGVSAFEPVHVLAFDARDAITYAGTPSGLFVGERRAAILERRLAFSGRDVFTISVNPLRRRAVSVGVRTAGVVASNNTGIELVTLDEPLPASEPRGIARASDDPEGMVVATERGLYRYVRGQPPELAENRLARLEAMWRQEPTVRETVEMALEYASLHRRRYVNLHWRARLAAVAPQMRANYKYTNGRPDQQQEFVVIDTDQPDDFDEDNYKDVLELYDLRLAERAPQVGNRHEVYVLFSWDLDRLVMNPDLLMVNRIGPLRISAENQIINRIQVVYGARRRLLNQITTPAPGDEPRDQAARLLRLNEFTAVLDGLTGGRFSEESEARRASADEKGRRLTTRNPPRSAPHARR